MPTIHEHRSDEEAFDRAVECIRRLHFYLYEEPQREYAAAGEPLGPDGLDMWLRFRTLTTVN